MPGMSKIRTICVYCGSGPGSNPRFIEAAIALGKVLAENRIRLVYGGGSIGLMCPLATSALDHGRRVNWVIPDVLTSREKAMTRLQVQVIRSVIHECNRIIMQRSYAVLAP